MPHDAEGVLVLAEPRLMPEGPIARIRRQLALIDYCSAKPPRTVWSRWLGANLWISLALAFPTALALDAFVVRETVVGTVENGQVWIEPARGGALPSESPLGARLVAGGTRASTWSDARPYATFTVRPMARWRGWPASSRDEHTFALLRIVPLEGLQERRSDAEERQAVAKALRDAGRTELSARVLRDTDPSARTSAPVRWGALTFNALVAWPMIAAAGCAVIGALAAGQAFLRSRGARVRAERIRKGVCPVCRYDIRASVWTSQCPECGELLY
jgi:hypothetical protein